MQPFETPGYKTDLFAGFDAMLGIPAPAKENSPKIKPHVPREPRYVVDVKSGTAFKSISEAADMLDLPQHVLRFWESKFPQIKPIKLKGGRRYYRPDDIESLSLIKQLLYKQGYTIKGARKAFTEARRKKDSPEETMSETPPARKSRRKTHTLEDTPLFAPAKPAAAPTEAAPASLIPEAKRQQLSDIRDELLGLREMLASLPPLKADAFAD